MALVKCGECGGDMSTSAAACPKCGWRLNAQVSVQPVSPPPPTPVPPPPPKIGFFDLKRNAIQLTALVVLGAIVWHFLPAKLKEDVRASAAVTGVDRVLPWEQRAQNLSTAIMSAKGTGEGIVKVTHPTATYRRCGPVTSSADGATVYATVQVWFTGALTGTEYRMTVRWSFTRAQHVRCEILEDTAPFPVLTGSVLDSIFNDQHKELVRRLGE